MSQTLLVCGYGPGISAAVAEKFGSEGFSVALVARNADRLSKGVDALQAKGVKAAAFPADLGDVAAIRRLVGEVRSALGPITAVHWNAYAAGAGDVLTADIKELGRAFDVAVGGLVATVQESLPDLKQQKDAAILVTNGGFGLFDPQVDAYAAQVGAMGLAIANSAKHKLVGLLAEKLRPEGVYVGEVMVLGTVKGTAWDSGNATLEPSAIANKFWDLYRARSDVRAQIG